MKNDKKIIIGLVGESGSGKDTVADYLKEKYHAKLMRFADPLREALETYMDNISREDFNGFHLSLGNRFGNSSFGSPPKKN